MTKIIDYLKTNKVGASLSLVLFLLIFIMPKTAGDNATLLKVYQLSIFILGFVYLFYKIITFKKSNPNFKATESQTLVNAGGSIIAIIVGLLFGLLLMLIVNPGQAFPGFLTIIVGGFDSFKSIGNMIYLSTPIILTGLAVAFAFRTGLFNIGATGQLTMGAFIAVYIGVKWGAVGEISPFLHWGLAILFAAIVGGIWGAIPGLLKAYRNVNEVVSAIMLNYVAMFLNTLLITSFIYNSDYARAMD
ncbi:MAG: ABC transporter permease, partial [Bacilli bacterium]|nr:ABC transporter permease [Bacilli bacterium]